MITSTKSQKKRKNSKKREKRFVDLLGTKKSSNKKSDDRESQVDPFALQRRMEQTLVAIAISSSGSSNEGDEKK